MEVEPGLPAESNSGVEVGGGVALGQVAEDLIGDRLEGGDDEQDPEPGEAGDEVGMGEEMLDFDRQVECEVRMPGVDRLEDPHGVGGTVPEVGISEGHVLGPRLDEPVDVGDDVDHRDDAVAAVVHARQRAVATPVPAAATRLHRPHHPAGAVHLEVRIASETGEGAAVGNGPRRGPTHEDADAVYRVSRVEPLDPRHEVGQVLTRDRPIDVGALGADTGVETEEGDGSLKAPSSHLLDERERQPGGGVHGNRDGDGLGVVDGVPVDGLDGEVEGGDCMAPPAESSCRKSHVKGLVAELVGGDEKDAHGGQATRPPPLCLLDLRPTGCEAPPPRSASAELGSVAPEREPSLGLSADPG